MNSRFSRTSHVPSTLNVCDHRQAKPCNRELAFVFVSFSLMVVIFMVVFVVVVVLVLVIEGMVWNMQLWSIDSSRITSSRSMKCGERLADKYTYRPSTIVA